MTWKHIPKKFNKVACQCTKFAVHHDLGQHATVFSTDNLQFIKQRNDPLVASVTCPCSNESLSRNCWSMHSMIVIQVSKNQKVFSSCALKKGSKVITILEALHQHSIAKIVISGGSLPAPFPLSSHSLMAFFISFAAVSQPVLHIIICDLMMEVQARLAL